MTDIIELANKLAAQGNAASHNSAALAAAWICRGLHLQLTTVREPNVLPLSAFRPRPNR